jgi:predicted transcriptional regulator
MKTAISLPDEIFEKAERLARRLKKSRSELYREALAEYVARHDLEAITAAMNRVADQIETAPQPPLAEASRRILERTEW